LAQREARGTFQPKHLRKGRWFWVTCTTAEAMSALGQDVHSDKGGNVRFGLFSTVSAEIVGWLMSASTP
jgi:hypothetical protein